MRAGRPQRYGTAADCVRQSTGNRLGDEWTEGWLWFANTPLVAPGHRVVCAVAASRVAVRGHASVADVVEDIADDQGRLEGLSSTGDERSAVLTVSDWSYLRLPANQTHRTQGPDDHLDRGTAVPVRRTGRAARDRPRQREQMDPVRLRRPARVRPAGGRRVHDPRDPPDRRPGRYAVALAEITSVLIWRRGGIR